MKTVKRHRGPRGLATTLSRVTGALFRARGFAEAGVLTDWPDIVGRPLADVTCPLRLGRDGALEVRVSGAWALELAHLEPVLLERIAGYCGYRAVTRLRIVQGPLPSRPAPGRRRVHEIDADAAAALKAHLAGTRDADVRAALERLGRKVMATRSESTGAGKGFSKGGDGGRDGA